MYRVSHNITYEFAYEYAYDKDESTSIPKIWHFLWISKPLQDEHVAAISKFAKNNPNFEVCKKI